VGNAPALSKLARRTSGRVFGVRVFGSDTISTALTAGAALLLSERPSPQALVGLLLIFAGLAAVRLWPGRRAVA
jgi:drug/metabolite transporter (DMT)-like permease